MQSRPYRNASDLEALQRFIADAWAATDGCGYLHPGDIAHHLFSGNKLYDPSQVLTIWEDTEGIAAFQLVSSRYRMYDVQIRPDLRNPELEREFVSRADAELLRLIEVHGIDADRITAESDRDDSLRAQALTDLGWKLADEPPWRINRASLTDLPQPEVAEGYTIRQVGDLSEAADLALVHAAAFGSIWTTEMYRKLMGSPGYAMEREWVVVADDGEYAAFTVTWRDPINLTGLFEPVGTHPGHRRRGLGKAMLLTVLHAMADEGMEHGIVVSEGTNEGSNALYQSAGFAPWRLIDNWSKPVGSGSVEGRTLPVR